MDSPWTLGSTQHGGSQDSHFLHGGSKIQEIEAEGAGPLKTQAQNWPSLILVIVHWLKQLLANSGKRGRERVLIS